MANKTKLARVRRPSRRVMGTPDGEQVVRAVICRAAEDVALACRFLEAAGVIPPESKRMKNPVPVPLALLLKIAAYVRLLRWERAAQLDELPELPAPQTVLDDLASVPSGGGQRLEAAALAARVFGAWFRRMSWASPVPAADVVLRGNDPEAVLDELAQLLWTCRELGDKEN